MIKAVLMDIDNTLLDFNASAEMAMKMAFNIHGLKFADGYFSVFKRVNDGLWLKIEKKIITRAELHKIRFNLILRELGMEYDGEKIEKDFLESLNVCAVHIDGAQELLRYLSEKYILCSASNAPRVQQYKRLEYSGLIKYFRHLFISEEIGYNKPDARFFDACFKKLPPIPPAETVIVGDSLTADIAGGKNYGMTTVWFDREGGAAQGAAPDYTAASLAEIKDIL